MSYVQELPTRRRPNVASGNAPGADPGYRPQPGHTLALSVAWYRGLFALRGADEDSRSREAILNVLLWFSVGAFLILNIIRLTDVLTRPADNGLPIIYTLAIMIFFLFLLGLSRGGLIKTASWLLLAAYSLPMFYCFLAWGADLPAAILLAVLIITLSGVLIGDNLVLISTVLISLAMITLTYLQSAGLIGVDYSWHSATRDIGDAIANVVLLSVIAAIAWFFAREIGRALARARRSEEALRQERDSLEIKVRDRTAQLRQAEADKINQLYRLAEFGRLSSGLFHDLVNPLTAVSLNLEQVKTEATATMTSVKSSLNQALLATHKMEGLIAGIKKQIRRENQTSRFSANQEIGQILEILSYKSRQARTAIKFSADGEIYLQGDAVKFGQIIINLLANAIEASEDNGPADREVTISLKRGGTQTTVSVSDHGAGIAPKNIARIFEPFFSTKADAGRGLGLGLSSTKTIVEKDFGGAIAVVSVPGHGSEFTVSLPNRPATARRTANPEA